MHDINRFSDYDPEADRKADFCLDVATEIDWE